MTLLRNGLTAALLTCLTAGTGWAGTVTASALLPISRFAYPTTACADNTGCSVSNQDSVTARLAPFDASLGILQGATVSYNITLNGEFITRAATAFGTTGNFRTNAFFRFGGTLLSARTTGDVKHTSNSTYSEGFPGQRVNPYTLTLKGSANINSTGLGWDPANGPAPLNDRLIADLDISASASFDDTECFFLINGCGVTNRVKEIGAFLDIGPIAGFFQDGRVSITYNYQEFDTTGGPGGTVPLPAAAWMLIAGLSALAFQGRRRG